MVEQEKKEVTSAKQEAKDDAAKLREKVENKTAKEAREALEAELQENNQKNEKDPEARKAYVQELTKQLEKNGILPKLSVEWLSANKDQLGVKDGLTKSKIESEIAKAKDDPLRAAMLSDIAKRYEGLRKQDANDGKDGITESDLNARLTKEAANATDDQSRKKLATELGINADAKLQNGRTLYEVAKEKLEIMNSARPENERKPITNKEIFEECSLIMQRTNDGRFTDIDQKTAGERRQAAVPLDWNSLTSRTQLRVFTKEDLEYLQAQSSRRQSDNQDNGEKKKDENKDKNQNNKQNKEESKEDSKEEQKEDKEQKDEKENSKEQDTDSEKQESNSDKSEQETVKTSTKLANGQTREIERDAQGNVKSITYADASGVQRVFVQKEEGKWVTVTGDKEEPFEGTVKVAENSVTIQSGRMMTIDYNNGTVVDIDGPKQIVKQANGTTYETADGKSWTRNGQPSLRYPSVDAGGNVTEKPIANSNPAELTPEEMEEGRRYVMANFSAIAQSFGGEDENYITYKDLSQYRANAKLTEAQRKYLDYLYQNQKEVMSKSNDEIADEVYGITKKDLNWYTFEKLSAAGKLDLMPTAENNELSEKEMREGRQFVMDNFARIANSWQGDDAAYITYKDLSQFRANADLTPAQRKYLDYLYKHQRAIMERHDDEYFADCFGITQNDLNTFTFNL
ncbi:MAG TPA: hypothetical protein V6D17_14075 [Candidatus Obscuribacterales bacterium]